MEGQTLATVDTPVGRNAIVDRDKVNPSRIFLTTEAGKVTSPKVFNKRFKILKGWNTG